MKHKKRPLYLVPVDFTFSIVFEGAIAFEATLYKFTKPLSKCFVVKKMVYAETRSGSFARISWTNSLLCGTNAVER